MKFEIPFNEATYRDQAKIVFERAWAKNKKNLKKAIISSSVSLALGCLILYGGGNIGGIPVIMGLFGLFFSARLQSAYKSAQEKYSKVIEKHIVESKAEPLSLWEFTDSYFRLAYHNGDYKIYWKALHYVERVESYLFWGSSNIHYYTLSESEIGKEDFDALEVFLKEKIKQE